MNNQENNIPPNEIIEIENCLERIQIKLSTLQREVRTEIRKTQKEIEKLGISSDAKDKMVSEPSNSKKKK